MGIISSHQPQPAATGMSQWEQGPLANTALHWGAGGPVRGPRAEPEAECQTESQEAGLSA